MVNDNSRGTKEVVAKVESLMGKVEDVISDIERYQTEREASTQKFKQELDEFVDKHSVH